MGEGRVAYLGTLLTAGFCQQVSVCGGVGGGGGLSVCVHLCVRERVRIFNLMLHRILCIQLIFIQHVTPLDFNICGCCVFAVLLIYACIYKKMC